MLTGLGHLASLDGCMQQPELSGLRIKAAACQQAVGEHGQVITPARAHSRSVATYKGLCCITIRLVLGGGCPPEAVVHPQRQQGRQHEALPVTAAIAVLQDLPQLGGGQELAGQQVAGGPAVFAAAAARSSGQQPSDWVWGGGLAAQLQLHKMPLQLHS
jgi:hypothetical protein